MKPAFFDEAMKAPCLADVEPPMMDQVKLLRDIANGFERSQALYTAMALGLFELLRLQPASPGEICKKTGIQPYYAASYLDMLVSLGVLAKSKGLYAIPTGIAPFLVESSPYYAMYLRHSPYRRKLWANLDNILRNGTPVDAGISEMRIDAAGIDNIAHNAMLGRLQSIVGDVASMPEFRRAKRLIDLGGGHGLFAIAFAQENVQLEALVFDRPEVAALAERYIDKAGLCGRVKTAGGDYTKDDIGDGYDVALDICSLSGSVGRARDFYGKVARCLNPGGLFVKTTLTLDDDRCGPPLTLMFDLEEKLSGHGHLHPANGELIGMLRDQGLELLRYRDMADIMGVPMRTFVFKKNR